MSDTSWRRIPGALIDPVNTFAKIAERPTWVLALVVLIAVGIGLNLVLAPKLDYGAAVRQAIEARGVSINEEQIDTQVQVMERFGWLIGLLGVVVFQPVGFALIALVFWMAFKILGSEMQYRPSLGVTVHAMLPLVIATLVTTALVFGRETVTVTELQDGVVKSNLSFLAGEDASATVKAALRGIDFFKLWSLGLLVIGYRAATRLGGSTVTFTVVALWAVWFAIRVGWAAIFG